MRSLHLQSSLLCEFYQALAACLTSETRLIHKVARLVAIAKQWKRQNYDNTLSIYLLAMAVNALINLYSAFGFPLQLTNWNINGGDPCAQNWLGVVCSGSNVTEMCVKIYLFFPQVPHYLCHYALCSSKLRKYCLILYMVSIY
jgi:hypothetical protein